MARSKRAARKAAAKAAAKAPAAPPPPAAPPHLSVLVAPVGVLVQAVQPPTPSAEMAELIAAIDTLYQDELKPYGRILRKRLAERARAERRRAGDLGLRRLRGACEACPWLAVQAEEGGDWSVQIRGRPTSFVDVHSPQDRYPPELWEQAAAYFGSIRETDPPLPGGRYACAQILMLRQLPFFANRSLGEVCHIVQLAISEKKILGYLNGTIVPYRHSLSRAKEECAQQQVPFFPDRSDELAPTATWETLRFGLRELFAELGSEETPRAAIPLSNVKRLFRTRFQVEVSETALGCAKLSELLQDPRLSDMCTVQLTEQGYMLAPRRAAPPAQRTIRLAEHLASGAGASSSSSSSAAAAAPPPQRAVPAQLGRRAAWVQPLDLEEEEDDDDNQEALGRDAPSGATGGRATPGHPSGGPEPDAAEPWPMPVCPPTPSPTAREWRPLPTLLGYGRHLRLAPGPAGAQLLDSGKAKAEHAPVTGASSSIGLAIGEDSMPTGGLSAGGGGGLAGPLELPPSVHEAVSAPSGLNVNLTVQNTFIHTQQQPASPRQEVLKSRSRSL